MCRVFDLLGGPADLFCEIVPWHDDHELHEVSAPRRNPAVLAARRTRSRSRLGRDLQWRMLVDLSEDLIADATVRQSSEEACAIEGGVEIGYRTPAKRWVIALCIELLLTWLRSSISDRRAAQG